MKLIVACDINGGIGYKNKLPWSKIEGDLPRFKQLTMNKIVIMGRNTWESLPKKPLPNRINYIVTSNPLTLPFQIDHEKIYGISNLNILRYLNNDACIIGGAKLIENAWDYITEIHLSKTFVSYECDAFIDLNHINTNYKLYSTQKLSDHDYLIFKK